jgi:hypothetical protein
LYIKGTTLNFVKPQERTTYLPSSLPQIDRDSKLGKLGNFFYSQF